MRNIKKVVCSFILWIAAGLPVSIGQGYGIIIIFLLLSVTSVRFLCTSDRLTVDCVLRHRPKNHGGF